MKKNYAYILISTILLFGFVLLCVFEYKFTRVVPIGLMGLCISILSIMFTIVIDVKRVCNDKKNRFQMFVIKNLENKLEIVKMKVRRIVDGNEIESEDDVFESELLNVPYFSKMFEQYYYKLKELTLTKKIDIKKIKQLGVNFELQINEIIFKIYKDDLDLNNTDNFTANFNYL